MTPIAARRGRRGAPLAWFALHLVTVALAIVSGADLIPPCPLAPTVASDSPMDADVDPGSAVIGVFCRIRRETPRAVILGASSHPASSFRPLPPRPRMGTGRPDFGAATEHSPSLGRRTRAPGPLAA